MLPHDKYVMRKHIIKYLFVALFIMFFSTIIIPSIYFALNYDLLPKAPIYRLVLEKIIPHPITKSNLHFAPFRLSRRSRDESIFAVAISPPKTASKRPQARFTPLFLPPFPAMPKSFPSITQKST